MTKKDKKNTEIEDARKKPDELKGEEGNITEDALYNEKENLENYENKSTEENVSSEEIWQEEIEKLKDEKLRLLAEMENLRKRSDRDRVDSMKYGSVNLARDILSPDDNLTRALDAIPDEEKNTETINNLIDGLKMVQKEFSTILEKHGVQKIDAINKKFDHNFHQAMVEVENDDVLPGTVVQEMQKGYIMHDRLLRPSMVAVSKKSNNDEKDDKKQ